MTDVPRVLLVVPDLNNSRYYGGIQVFNRFFVRATRDLGVALKIVAVNDRPDEPHDDDTVCCNRGQRLRKLIAAFHAARLLRGFKPHGVVVGHANFAPLCAKLCAAAGKPFLTICHGVDVWSPPPKIVHALDRSPMIVAVSRDTKARVEAHCPGHDDRWVRVFPNTYDDHAYTLGEPDPGLRAKLGVREDEKVILTVARMDASDRGKKGFDRVLRALPTIAERVPTARYVLAGRGDDRPRLEALADSLGVSDRVTFAGFVPTDELPSYYRMADVYCMPSTGEGFGIVFLEAMSCGCPVVAGNRDGSVEPLMDGELGLLVDPEDQAQIADAVCRVLLGEAPAQITDPTRLHESSVDAFGRARFRQRLEAIYRDLGIPLAASTPPVNDA